MSNTVYVISTQFIDGQFSFQDRITRLENRADVIQYLTQQFALESDHNDYIQKRGYDHFLRWARTRCDIYEINLKKRNTVMLKPVDFSTATISKDIL